MLRKTVERSARRRSPRAAASRARSSIAPGEVPQLQIEIDRARAARYGLNVADVEDVIETALGGRPATADVGGRASASTWSCGCARTSGATCESIGNVLIDTPSGSRIPLAQVATFVDRQRRMNISARRRAARRSRSASSSRTATWAASSRRCSSRSNGKVQLPPGYYTDVGRRVREPAARDGAARLIVPISILLIFVLLFNAFSSSQRAR